MNKRVFSILLVCLLLISTALPVSAAKKESEKEPITIATTAQFLAFAEDCRLDTYSQNLTVSLASDLDFSEIEFQSVPIFSGTFQGNGHTISGLELIADGSVQGLFRYLTETAIVQDLHLKGEIAPEGSRSAIGALAGDNAGLILNCSFNGNVSGGDGVGGIAGINGVTGVIESCSVQGSVNGTHFVGGLAGENYGVIRGCENFARVNATSQDNSIQLNDITIQSLTGAESTATVTDLGGIAGISSGVIRDCKNRAVIGYRHMGYNIGGIAGTQSGYIVDCENTEKVYGRKEVGGIVGHMEPFSVIEYRRDTLQILEGQLNTLSGLTNQASSNAMANAGSISGPLSDMQGHADTARDAVDTLLGGSADPDAITAARGSLSSSISGMTGSMSQIGTVAADTATELSRDMQAISNQISTMSKTLNAASDAVGGSFEDVSDADTAKELGGKVENCINRGEVFGDMNIGGIAGAMAMENDLDAEEDWNVSGDDSMNVSGEIRAVILGCENDSVVTGNKRNIGGVVGWQYMGLVKECLNLGAVEASAADYVGGISGQSNGFIRMSSAKCTLDGETYVGGIAGCAGVVSDCRSMVELLGGTERVGAILGCFQEGDSEEKQPVRENYYMIIDRDPGAIDGISYSGLAEPKDMEAFVSLKELEEPFRTATLRFVYETGDPVELTVPLGGSLSKTEIPEIPEREGFVSEWEGLSDVDLSNILFDMEFHVLYVSRDSVLSSADIRENGLPVVLVQGVFTSDTYVKLKEVEDGPAVGFGKVLQEVWEVAVSERDTMTAVRFLLPMDADSDHIRMYVRSVDGDWRDVEFAVDGSYAVVAFTANDSAIAFAKTPVWMYMAIVALLGAALLIWQYKDKFKKQ